ncbi:MAG: hypothetical protein RBU45_07860 [Myxococcota bacterium]|nr:hypothetical protein [Myxococcota bacterium]
MPTGQLLVETGSCLVATGLRAGRFAPLLAKARRWIDSSARLY